MYVWNGMVLVMKMNQFEEIYRRMKKYIYFCAGG